MKMVQWTTTPIAVSVIPVVILPLGLCVAAVPLKVGPRPFSHPMPKATAFKQTSAKKTYLPALHPATAASPTTDSWLLVSQLISSGTKPAGISKIKSLTN